MEEHIGTIFNCRNITCENVKFDAYNRLTANWSFDDYVDHDNSFLIFHDCDLKTSSFVMEGRYDKIDIYNSQLRTREDKSDYGHDIISTRAYNSNPTSTNAYIFITNSIIEGGIELVGTQSEARTNTYKKVTVTNSLLRYFRLGFHGGSEYGITDMEVSNCISYVGKGNGFYNGINSVIYRNCHFYLTTYNSFSVGPFQIQTMHYFEFDTCIFDVDKDNDNVYASILHTNSSSIYPDDFADNIKIKLTNCNISSKWLGNSNICISLTTKNIVFNDTQAENAITIKNCKLTDIDSNTITSYAGLIYASDDGAYRPRLLPIENFKLSYEVLSRLRLNMINENIKGELRGSKYEKWGIKSIPITYINNIKQFIQNNGISWNSVRPIF